MTAFWTFFWLLTHRPEVDLNATGDPKQWATWLVIAVALDLLRGWL